MNEEAWDDRTLELLRKALVSPAMLATMNGITAARQPAPEPSNQSTTSVALVQDGIAHRPWRTDGERVQVACRTEGSLPLDLFDIQMIHKVRPELRCALCFLTPVVVVCQRHISWMPQGQDCPDCKAAGLPTVSNPIPTVSDQPWQLSATPPPPSKHQVLGTDQYGNKVMLTQTLTQTTISPAKTTDSIWAPRPGSNVHSVSVDSNGVPR